MKVLADYVRNALFSALIGFLIAAALELARGSAGLSFVFAGACALTGVVCGTASKGIIEGAFSLFGRRPSLAYVLNAAVILLVVSLFVLLYFGDLRNLRPLTVAIGFLGPVLGSSLIIRGALKEADDLEKAFRRKRRELGDEADTP
jgi:hypothetical protein